MIHISLKKVGSCVEAMSVAVNYLFTSPNIFTLGSVFTILLIVYAFAEDQCTIDMYTESYCIHAPIAMVLTFIFYLWDSSFPAP